MFERTGECPEMDEVTRKPAPQAGQTITDYRLGLIEETLQKIVDTLARFAVLEERHLATNQALERAFNEIGAQNQRLTTIEQEMPTLKLVRGWVLALMTGSFGTLLSILAVLVFGSPL